MRVLLGVVAVLLLLVIGLGVWVFTGGHKVSVADSDPGPVRWITDSAMRQSVRSHAKGIEVPNLSDPAMAEEGAKLYDKTCLQCHGAPGVPPAPFARATNPAPADLAATVPNWSAAQLFWITRHGLKMTGMPAYADILVDGEIWNVVAFLGQLAGMPPERYQQMVAPPPPPPEPEPAPEAQQEQPVPPPEGEEAPAPEATPAPETVPAPPAPPVPPER